MAFLDSIKDRLGFGEAEEEEFDEELYGEDFDSYTDNYNEHESYDEDDYKDDASEHSSFVPASTREGSRRERSGSSRARRGAPNLVSIEDVRNSTRIPDSLNRDPLPPRRTSSFGRNSVGHASDFALSGSESSSGYGRPDGSRSGSYYGTEGNTATKPVSDTGAATQPASSGYDPYRVYEAGSATSHRPTRSVSVISPVAYSEVENVARMLRAGDAVVLSLRNTPSQLSKRILDFSFGVASALDATVDCVSDKVFAITRVYGLDNDEMTRLRAQGVI